MPRPQITIEAFMISCAQRRIVREETLADFDSSDWGSRPEVVIAPDLGEPTLAKIRRTWRVAVEQAAASSATAVLVVEDDIAVNKWLHHNLVSWRPLAEMESGWFFGSLYNPHVLKLRDEPRSNYFWAAPDLVWGAQALLMSPRTAELLLTCWEDNGHADRFMPRIASTTSRIVYHSPSLVDHRRVPSTWTRGHHRAIDFDPLWKAPLS